MNATESAPVKSALRTLDVIEFVVAHRQGVVAKDISGGLGIPLSSLSYLLATLTSREYLRRDGRRYLPGPSLERLRASSAPPTLEDRIVPIIRSITAELNETTSFMVRDGWEAKIVATEAGAQALRYAIDPGQRKPLHTLAAGKALLAGMGEDELARYFAETVREPLTERTITEESDLRAEIAKVQGTGLAIAREESTAGICSIGCPVRVDGAVIGAIGIAVPTIRFTGPLRDRARQLLRRAAEALSG